MSEEERFLKLSEEALHISKENLKWTIISSITQIMAFILALYGYTIQNLFIFIIGMIFLMAMVIAVYSSSYSSSSQKISSDWYKRIESIYRLWLLVELLPSKRFVDMLILVIKANITYAKLEGRTELAEHLRGELKKLEELSESLKD